MVGIVKDFHYADLHQPVQPYGFFLTAMPFTTMLSYMPASRHIQQLLKSLETTWRKLDPSEPFDYSFLDEDFQKNYLADNRLSSLVMLSKRN